MESYKESIIFPASLKKKILAFIGSQVPACIVGTIWVYSVFFITILYLVIYQNTSTGIYLIVTYLNISLQKCSQRDDFKVYIYQTFYNHYLQFTWHGDLDWVNQVI